MIEYKEVLQYKEVEGIDASTYAGKAAIAVKTKAKGIMGEDLLIFNLVDFVSFITLQNKFADKGIFITDTNKEQCYIKIIEQGDESLISDLERFINLLDSIREIEKQKEEYQSVISKLKNLSDYSDADAVNAVVEDYLRR
jgi:hypothetical protein